MEKTMSKHEYNIAMLLATRGRTESLGRSIHSLVELADDISRVQIMFAFDNDDDIGFKYFVDELQPWMDQRDISYTAMKFERMGYVNLHKYNNAMAKQTDSNWLVIWNDDAVMQSQGWDTTIMSYEGQFKLLSFKTHNMHPYSIFPIVPRTWYDLLGYISPHPTQDGWVSQQAYMLDIYQRITVDVLHDRFDLTGNNDDDIFANRPMLEGNPSHPMDFHSKEMIDLRHLDCAKLATYMRRQGLSTTYFENIFKGDQDPWQRLAENDINSQMVQFANPHAVKV
jgi:hypothetical protein